ncbi:MAG TPA: alpha/beta hydrolase [Candidatus Thermoplasmatota archaeon]|nr:alpha/beta hydrolase [Candidatus Thermoplasmatota archaeon]
MPDYAKAGLPRALRTYRHALRHPMLARAARVPCPALVVRGTRDPIVPRPWAEALARALPQGRLVEVEGAHVLNYTHPGRLDMVLRPFLSISQESPISGAPRAGLLGAARIHKDSPQFP